MFIWINSAKKPLVYKMMLEGQKERRAALKERKANIPKIWSRRRPWILGFYWSVSLYLDGLHLIKMIVALCLTPLIMSFLKGLAINKSRKNLICGHKIGKCTFVGKTKKIKAAVEEKQVELRPTSHERWIDWLFSVRQIFGVCSCCGDIFRLSDAKVI